MARPIGPGGKEPKPKPIDPVRDRPQDPGHGTAPVSGRPPEPVRDRPQDPGHGTAPVSGNPAPSPPAWVIRRQQILKRSGFGVATDGQWGPNSAAAWAAYQAGQKAAAGFKAPAGPQAAIPKGFVYYNGRVIPKQIANAAQAVANAKKDASSITNRHFFEEMRQTRMKIAAQKAMNNVVRSGEDLHTAYALSKAAQQRRHNLVAAHQNDLAQDAARRDQLLFGVHGPAMLALNPKLAHQRLAQLATAHDLSRMVKDGTLDIRRAADVATIQRVVKREGEDVKITGKYDAQTDHAITSLFRKEAAKDFTKGVQGLKRQFFDTGLGQWATFKVFGKSMSAAETYGVLSRGGPRAARLARYLGDLYVQSEPLVDQARQQLAAGVYHTQTGDVHYGTFTHSELLHLLGKDTFKAHNLQAVYARYGAEADRLRGMQQKHATSWWQDAVGYVYQHVDIPYSNDAVDLLSWSGHQGYHLVATSYIFVASNLDALNNSEVGLGSSSWLGKATGLSVDVPGLGIDAIQRFSPMPAVTQYLLPDESAWRGRGPMSPDQAWHNGWVTMSDMQKADPLRAMVWESVADPLNLIGVGEGTSLTKLTTRGIGVLDDLGTRAVVRAAWGDDIVSQSPALSKMIREAAQASVVGHTHIVDLSKTLAPLSPMNHEWAASRMLKLVSAKGDAIGRATGGIRADVARNFQDFTQADIIKKIVPPKAGTPEAADFTKPPDEAAHITAEERNAALKTNDRGKYASRSIDPVLHEELQRVMAEQVSVIKREFQGFAQKIEGLSVSLYRHRDRVNGQLSRSGVRIGAWLTEMGNRSILDALAVHAAQGDADRLAVLRSQLGSWYAGHLNPEIADYATQALSDFKRVLYEQILPDLDSISRSRLSEHAFDKDGWMFAGVDEAAFSRIEEMMGFKLSEVFDPKNFVKVLNPEETRTAATLEAGKLIAAETDRRWKSLDIWADSAIWAARNDPKAPARIHKAVVKYRAEIADEINSAWRIGQLPGTMRDSRDFLTVPSIYAHGTPAFGEMPAMSPFGEQVQKLIDAALSTGSTPVASGMPPAGLPDLISKRADAMARARSSIAAHYYRQEFLLVESFNKSQSQLVRYSWGGYKYAMEAWRFAVLPARLAFAFKNFVEDFAKMILSGYRDFRLLMNTRGQSPFDFAPYRLVRAMARNIDRVSGTDLAERLDGMLKGLIAQHPEKMSKWFGAHGVPIPEDLFTDKVALKGFLDENADEASDEGAHLLRRMHDRIWDLMGTRPDNWRKRAFYAHAYNKALQEGKTERQAANDAMNAFDAALDTGQAKPAELDALAKEMDAALAVSHGATGPDALAKIADNEVDRVLFLYDADHITVMETQLKVLAPFIVYWRKNVQYFASQLNRTPYWFADGKRLYDLHTEENKDQPPWQRRYFSLGFLGGIADSMGAPEWMGDAFREAYFDPMDYTGTAVFYRIFKQANPNLPDNQKGYAFVSNLVSNLNAFGLGLNPFATSIGEATGIINRQVWRDFFPQTSLLQALTTKGFIQDTFGSHSGFNIEDFISDPVLSKLGITPNSVLRQESMDYYVNQVIAGQIARGETPDRAKAEKNIGQWMALQQIVAFTTGVYMRHLSESDLHFYALMSEFGKGKGLDVWQSMSPNEQKAYQLWKRKGYSPERFDRYRAALEAAQPFYEMDDDAKQQYLAEHPEIIGIVYPLHGDDSGQPTQIAIRNQLLSQETGVVMELLTGVFSDPNFAPGINTAAYEALVTPDLKAFWAKNDTPMERRARHIKGAYFHYIDRMSRTFFSIPDKDYDSKQQFLASHPELNAYWALNDSASDDLRSIELSANATFRNLYFRFVDNGNWDGADAFLKRHSFIFDWTSAEGRVDPNGQWHPRTTAQADYAKVAERLGIYYTLQGHAREQYLAANPLISWYLKKYGHVGTDIFSKASSYSPGGLNQHAQDYQAVKAQLDAFFRLDNAGKEAFLVAHPELKAYFAKYGHQRTQSQHARAYLAIKPVMDQFFNLPEGDRPAFLAKHPELQAYFDTYGSHQHHADFRSVLAADPEMADRYNFWQHFFALPPDQRPAYIHKHGASAGIFIYGSLSYDQRQRDYQRWHREAVRQGISDRAVAFRHVKPLLDMYFKLKGKDRSLFAELNPEVQWYFDHYAKASKTIPPAIADELQTYFQFQPYSDARKEYILSHPDLADYFSSTQSPAEQAIMKQVEAFFALPFGTKRDDYLAAHAELGAWFDKRAAEKANYMSITSAFNDEDPRMKPFYEQYADIIPMDALKQWQLAHQHGKKSKTAHEISNRRGREEALPIVAPGWETNTG